MRVCREAAVAMINILLSQCVIMIMSGLCLAAMVHSVAVALLTEEEEGHCYFKICIIKK